MIVGAVIAGTTEPDNDISPAVVDMVDTLEAQGDCESLQAAFDRYDDADTLNYIDDALRDAGCYEFVRIANAPVGRSVITPTALPPMSPTNGL